jgi:flavin-dependent dehydrogenase
MAGLLAARVLADHVDRVTIIERDHLPETPQFRAGVPQSRHLHGLLERGRLLLEQLFPGLGADLAAAGALTVTTADFLWLTPAGWMQRFRPGIPVLLCSRELLEWSVRRHVAAMGRVCIRQDCDVTGLLPNQERTAVVGVQLHTRTRGSVATAGTEDVRADLVVDASGQYSRAPRWLEALGYPPPQETVINAFLGYASRYYARPSGAGADWKMLALFPKPPGLGRLGVLAPIEGDRWLVTLGGYGRDYPPTDEAGFLAFARSLRSPLLYDAIKDAQPLSSIVGYQRTANRLHRYDRLPRQPERFLVLGDAVCAFNPVYGQGMTVAARAALVLDRCLCEQRRRQPAGDLAGLARHFQQQLAHSNAPAWLMATGEDLRYPTTEGARPDLPTRLMHRYLDRVIRVSTQNPTVNRTFFSAMHMLTPPTAMFRPAVLLPTLLAGGRPGLAEPPLEAAHGGVRAERAAAPLVS